MTANAGILGRAAGKKLDEVTDDEIAQTMNVNFMGVLNAFRAAIPAIRRARGGAMTATASLAAIRGYATPADLRCVEGGRHRARPLCGGRPRSRDPRQRRRAGAMATEVGEHAAKSRA